MDLHVFFLPFLTPGHMNPMVDLARLFADRGARATVVTTAANVHRVKPTTDRASNPVEILTIPFPYLETGIPEGHENLTNFSTPDLTPGFVKAISLLEPDFRNLVDLHRPDFVISDVFYPWTAFLPVPRIEFHGSSFFSFAVLGTLSRIRSHDAVDGDHVPFVVPDMPHRIELTRSQLPSFLHQKDDVAVRMIDASRRNFGMVMNSFYELEPEYMDKVKRSLTMKLWNVGPVSLCHVDAADLAARGDRSCIETDVIVNWLDTKSPGSVLYICFGSLGKFAPHQLAEMAVGLRASGRPFVWVVGNQGHELPEGFEKSIEGYGLLVKGWAPQILILGHRAIGGFMTHCGWNSCLEGASAGVPMVTWPLFAEQFVNEKLLVDVLGIGVSVGSRVCCNQKEERTVVSADAVREAVEKVLEEGEEGEERRRRASEISKMAKKAVEEGGSSHSDMCRLIEDLMDAKRAVVKSESGDDRTG